MGSLYVGRKLLGGLAALVVASMITFLATNLTGINPARAALGRLATAQQVKEYALQQGLGHPLLIRYWVWFTHAVVGNWGYSITQRVPVSQIVPLRAEHSLILAAVAFLFAVPLATLMGVMAAWRAGGVLDGFLSASLLIIVGVPEFVIGIGFLFVLSVWLHLLPPVSSAITYGSFGQQAQALVLPVLTLALVETPYMARMVRGSVRDVLRMPYVRAAQLRGVRTYRLIARHILPNAAGPVVNVVALSLAEILAGEVIVENVFGYPGLGQLTVSAATTADIAVVQICVLLIAGGFVGMSIIADLALILLNPRLRRRQV